MKKKQGMCVLGPRACFYISVWPKKIRHLWAVRPLWALYGLLGVVPSTRHPQLYLPNAVMVKALNILPAKLAVPHRHLRFLHADASQPSLRNMGVRDS